MDRALANATAIIRRALPYNVYKPPVATKKGLPPIDILRRMFIGKTDQELLDMDKETVSVFTYSCLAWLVII